MAALNTIHRGMCILSAAGLLAAHFFLFSPSASAANPAEAERPILPSANTFDAGQYRGKNMVLLFYALDEPRTESAIALMNDLYALRKEYNFEIAGVCLNAEKPAEVLRYNTDRGVSFPVFLDQGRELSAKLKLKGGLGFFIYNKQGAIVGDKMAAGTPPQTDLARLWLAVISKFLKIPYIPPDQPLLGIKPPVPIFEAQAISGPAINIKKMYQSKPLVMVIFSPRCSHCQEELDFLNSLYNDGDLKGKFEVLAISRLDAPATLSFFQNKKYAFPAVIDTDNKISSLFPSFVGNVPLSYLVDRQGRINFMHNGFTDRSKDTYLMELRKMCGLKNPPRLNASGYSGQDRCIVCHEKEHIQWRLSRHSDALLSLVRKGKEDDPACITCHVTGFGKPGGYSADNKKDSQYFEGVQCEACHGPGYEACAGFTGAGKKKRPSDEWKALCISCHTEKESLNFNFSSRFPKILHTNIPDLSSMDLQSRVKLLSSYREKHNMFDSAAGYAGAESCRKCHAQEFDRWQVTAHASAHKTPASQAAPREKQYRYNTGAESPGGYPEPGREGVQCEACHGPGENHIKKPEAKGQSYIVGLGAECSSCVVEQICRKCHAPADDANFDFETYREKIKHRQ